MIMVNIGFVLWGARATCFQMAKRWPCTGEIANHDTVLGARNGVDIPGPSLGLTIAGLGSEPYSIGIGISIQYLAYS